MKSVVGKLYENPYLLLGEFRQAARKFNSICQRLYADKGELAIEKDWDNLIILDACRYDYFSEQNHLEGELTKFSSAASQSWEFMEKNFQGRRLHDTVYVTANPFAPRLDESIFHSLVNLLTEWDENKQTVLPDTVIENALEADQEYPQKRLIIHFMQPHYPFLGPTGESINHRGYDTDNTEPNIWEILQWRHKGYGEFDEKTVRKAYQENVDIAIDAASELLNEFTGKTVITADHGALIGDRMRPIPVKGYGHSAGFRVPQITEVPWFVPEYSERKTVTAEETDVYNDFDQSIVEERLESFGYSS